MFVANMRRLGELSAARRLPGVGSDEYAQSGGLLAYGVSFPELWRRAPYFVDRILKSQKPATIPVEQASKFVLTLNLKTAGAMGLVGRAVVALAADPDRVRWNGQSLSSGGLAKVYGFTDLDGSRPDCWRYLQEVQEAGKPADVTGYR